MTVQTSTLTESQHKFRKRVIGGSDANIIMSGDKDRIYRLWQEKRGEAEREDLSNVLPVQMGIWTEPFNLAWFERTTGRRVTDQGAEHISLDYPWMACTLDGLTDERRTVIDAKHVNAFSKEDEVRAKYTPQMTHNMIVTGLEQSVLSVFIGTFKHVVLDVEYDPLYAEQLIEAERYFWSCVTSGVLPVDIEPPKSPAIAIRKVDMRGSNEWGSAAAGWLANKDAAKIFETSSKTLKSLVADDVVEASGSGVKVTRNKAGSLSIGIVK